MDAVKLEFLMLVSSLQLWFTIGVVVIAALLNVRVRVRECERGWFKALLRHDHIAWHKHRKFGIHIEHCVL